MSHISSKHTCSPNLTILKLRNISRKANLSPSEIWLIIFASATIHSNLSPALAYPSIQNITHSLTHSITHSLTHSLLTQSLTHSLTHSPTHPFTHSPTHALTNSLTHSLSHSLLRNPALYIK